MISYVYTMYMGKKSIFTLIKRFYIFSHHSGSLNFQNFTRKSNIMRINTYNTFIERLITDCKSIKSVNFHISNGEKQYKIFSNPITNRKFIKSVAKLAVTFMNGSFISIGPHVYQTVE